MLFRSSLYREGTYDFTNPMHKTGAGYTDLIKNTIIGSGSPDLLEKYGSLTITKFDMSRRIIAGRFHFRMKHKDYGVYEATDGRFDISF